MWQSPFPSLSMKMDSASFGRTVVSLKCAACVTIGSALRDDSSRIGDGEVDDSFTTLLVT